MPAGQSLPVLAATLNAGQLSFAEHFVEHPKSAAAAVRHAGYASKAAAQTAWRLLRNPKVVAYIHALSASKLASLTPLAVDQLAQLLRANSEYVRLDAVKDTLDRAGFRAPERHRHEVSGEVSIVIDLT